MGETSILTGEFTGETHRVLEGTQTHPPGSQHQKGPICLWVAGEVTEYWQSPASGIVSSLTLLYHTAPKWLPHPDEYLRL